MDAAEEMTLLLPVERGSGICEQEIEMQWVRRGGSEAEGCVEGGSLVVEGVHQKYPDSDSVCGGKSRQDRVAYEQSAEA